jgi:hypothetical protein
MGAVASYRPAARILRPLLPDDGIVDPIAVEIAARGTRPVQLTRAERRAAAALILTRGGSAFLVSVRLRMSMHAARRLAATLAVAVPSGRDVA